jgi:hypothetical protein
MNQPEYLYNLYTGMWEPNQRRCRYKCQRPQCRTHLITGLVAGAAITYLLTNRNAARDQYGE